MDDTAPSAPEGAAPAASGPNDAPADPAAPRYKFPTWFDLLALVGLFVVIQLVVAFVLLLAGARMPDAAALGSADGHEVAHEDDHTIIKALVESHMNGGVILIEQYQRGHTPMKRQQFG